MGLSRALQKLSGQGGGAGAVNRARGSKEERLGWGGRRRSCCSGVAATGPGWPLPVSHPGQHCTPALVSFSHPTYC